MVMIKINFVGKSTYSHSKFSIEAKKYGVSRGMPYRIARTLNFGDKIYLATIQIPNFYDFLFKGGEKENSTSNKENKNTKKEPSDLFEQNKTNLSLEEKKTKDDLVRMTKNGVVEIEPIHITIDVNIKVDRALDITSLTFKVFNVQRA